MLKLVSEAWARLVIVRLLQLMDARESSAVFLYESVGANSRTLPALRFEGLGGLGVSPGGIAIFRRRRLERMALGVKDPFIKTDVRRVVKSKIQVLQHFCEPEALHVINFARGLGVDIIDASERNGSRKEFIEAIDSSSSTVQVLGIASDSPCVEVRFEDFRAEDIIGTSDVKAMLIIERCLCSIWTVTAREAAIRGFKGECFGADTSLSALVCVPAGIGQLKTVIDNGIVIQ